MAAHSGINYATRWALSMSRIARLLNPLALALIFLTPLRAADVVTLNDGQYAWVNPGTTDTNPGRLESGSPIGSAFTLDSDFLLFAPETHSVTDSLNTVYGTLKTSVYKSGAAVLKDEFGEVLPQFGGLVFVYELSNTLPPVTSGGHLGLIDLIIKDWSGLNVAVAYNKPDSIMVNPGDTLRGGGTNDDDQITFKYPPGHREPPIFEGEQGLQLVLFTDAVDAVSTTATVGASFFQTILEIPDDTLRVDFSASTYRGSSEAVASVPDAGSTVTLLAAALSGLLLCSRRRFAV